MSSLLRLLSIACSLVLLASFAMFATDQAGKGEKKTVATLNAGDSAAAQPPAPAPPAPKKHGAVRTAIDDASDKLVSPFKGVAAGGSQWTKHIVQTLLALLAFGLGLGFLARYAATRGV